MVCTYTTTLTSSHTKQEQETSQFLTTLQEGKVLHAQELAN